MKAICLYCGSNAGVRNAYSDAARNLGRTLAGRGIDLVFGGARVGLMGIAADAALVKGGRVLGVIPEGLRVREVGHEGLSELIVVSTMNERKRRMAASADGFIALPGGFGMLEELFEMLSWAGLGIHSRPIGLLQVEGYFDALLGYLDHAVEEGFVRPEQRSMLLVREDPEDLLDAMADYRPPNVSEWVSEVIP